MPVVYKAQLPRPLETDDQVVIKGTLKEDAIRISFNFIVNDNPAYVALHFKTHFCGVEDRGRAVVLNSKNVVWGAEEHHENSWQVDDDRQFHFVFMFMDDSIRIYTGSNAYLCSFQHRLNYQNITSFEVWDDMETVRELAYRYSNL